MTEFFYGVTGLDNPRLVVDWKNLPEKIKVGSFTSELQNYLIFPQYNQCSCPDFVETRSQFSKDDPRRSCKHLNDYFYKNGVFHKQSELTQIIMGSPARGPYLATMMFESGMIFSISFEDNGWKNVFTRRRKQGDEYLAYTGEYFEYGYNQGWSYGLAPPGGRVFRDAIFQIKNFIVENNLPKYVL